MGIRFILLSTVFSMLLASCNVFDPFEPNSNHFDRCKFEADKGNYDDAISECNKALEEAESANDTNQQVLIQTELGDIYLAKSGITLKALAEVFSSDANGASPVVALVNSIIANANEGDGTGIDDEGNPTKGITAHNIEYAEKAIDAFDSAASTGLYSDFAGLMARVCYIALVLAYTDNDGINSSKDNGQLEPEDICDNGNDCQVSVAGQNTFCMNSGSTNTCNGMSDTYAGKIANMFLTMGDELASLGIKADIGKATDALVSQKVSLVKCTRTGADPVECYTFVDSICDDSTEIAETCDNTTCKAGNTCSSTTEDQTVEWIFDRMGSSVEQILAGATRKALYDLVKANN